MPQIAASSREDNLWRLWPLIRDRGKERKGEARQGGEGISALRARFKQLRKDLIVVAAA